jgi:hypothetical protein
MQNFSLLNLVVGHEFVIINEAIVVLVHHLKSRIYRFGDLLVGVNLPERFLLPILSVFF